MKKYLLILIVVLPFVVSSCSKDKDVLKSLEGTVWFAEETNVHPECKLTFESTTFKMEQFESGAYWRTINGIYTYEYPSVKLITNDETVEMIISGNKMVGNADDNGTITFILQ